MASENRYKYYEAGNKIIAVTTYKGKTIRRVAVCADGDTFNREFGKKLARAKCEEKIAWERWNNKIKEFSDAINAEKAALDHTSKVRVSMAKARELWGEAYRELGELRNGR